MQFQYSSEIDSFRLRVNDSKTLILKINLDSLENIKFNYSLEDALEGDEYVILDLSKVQNYYFPSANFDTHVAMSFSNSNSNVNLQSVLSTRDTIQNPVGLGGPVVDFSWACGCVGLGGIGMGCYQVTFGQTMYCDGTQCEYCTMTVYWKESTFDGSEISSLVFYSL